MDTLKVNGCKNNGKLEVVEGNKDDVSFNDTWGMKYSKEDAESFDALAREQTTKKLKTE